MTDKKTPPPTILNGKIDLARAKPFRIMNAIEALALIDSEDVDLDSVDFRNFSGASLRLTGKDFHSTITPPIMDGYADLQRAIYRAYAIIKNGNGDIKALTERERRDFEIVISVREGSSLFSVENAPAIMKSFVEAMKIMNEKQRHILMAILAIIAILYIGKEGLSVWAQYQIENKKIEAASLVESEQTKRFERILALAGESLELKKIASEGDNARRSLFHGAEFADKIELDGREISASAVHQILERERVSIVPIQLNGRYKVLSVSASEEGHFNIRLTPEKGGEAFTATIEDNILKFFLSDVQKAFFERRALSFLINGRSRGTTLISAEVVGANE